MKIYMDDERTTPDEFDKRTYTAPETIEALVKYAGEVKVLSLDHDLGDPRVVGTGYNVMMWLECQANLGNYKVIPDTILFHTANPVGRRNMERALESIFKIRQKNIS